MADGDVTGGWPRPATGRVETFYLPDSQSIGRWHIIHVTNPLRERFSLSRGTQFDRYVADIHSMGGGGGLLSMKTPLNSKF
jgi:hypothetical protein